MLGQSYSTSRNAGMITFHGGPYDGQSGLYDHNAYDKISFCDAKQVTHDYRPTWRGYSWLYVFDRSYSWSS